MVEPTPTSVASSVTLTTSPTAPTSLTLLAALPDAAAPTPAGLSAAEGAATGAAAGAESAADQVLRKRFREIQAKVLRGRNDEAGREFLKLASDFPLSAIAPEALYEAAQLEKADIKVRLAGFSAIVDQYPSTPWAVRSLCEIGRTQFLLADYAAALDAFRAYQSRQGEEAQKPQLRVSIVYCLLQLRRYEEALDELDRLEVDFPPYRSAEKVLDLKSECQMALARYDEAIFSLRALLREYPNYALVPKALLSLGLCYEQTNRPDEARPVYVQLIQMYPPDRPDTPFETKMAAERIAQLDRPLLPQ
jgi:tetratricopeptide (TPR) repeat protein